MRRYGEARVPGQRYTFRPGVYVILPRNGRILLTFQAEPEPEIQVPGGGIDPGETPLMALHRECFEETGWRIAKPRRIGAYRRFTYMPEYDLWAEKSCLFYVAMPVRPHGPPTEMGHETRWLDPDTAVQAIASEGDRAMLLRALEGEFGPIF